MTPEEMLKILSTAAVLKTNTRHCFTEPGRKESIADHSWRTALMALLLTGEEEFRDVDMDRVIRMCLIHDLGEAVTGDIPSFLKTAADEATEEEAVERLLAPLPEALRLEFTSLFREMEELATPEARLFKVIDKLEAVIQHNESPISTWEALEYQLQREYGQREAKWFPQTAALREAILRQTEEKIAAEGERELGQMALEV